MLDTDFLKDSAIFRGLGPEQFETIGFVVDEVSIPTGHFLFKEGASARSLFIIRDGGIDIVKEGSGAVLATLGEGEIFGEMAVIRDTTRSTSARASGHCWLWTINREKLDTLRKKEPVLWGTLMFNIAGVLCDRLAAVTQRLSSSPSVVASTPSSAVQAEAEKGFWARLTGR